MTAYDGTRQLVGDALVIFIHAKGQVHLMLRVVYGLQADTVAAAHVRTRSEFERVRRIARHTGRRHRAASGLWIVV